MNNEGTIDLLAKMLEELSDRYENSDQRATLGEMANSDQLTDSKIAASEARAETKVARLEGKLDLVAQSIAALTRSVDDQRAEAGSNRNVIIATIVASALAVIGLSYAALSFGAANFANGLVVRDLVKSEVGQQATKPSPASSK